MNLFFKILNPDEDISLCFVIPGILLNERLAGAVWPDMKHPLSIITVTPFTA